MGSFTGLISNVLSNAGKGLTALGEQGLKKQTELDLRKQLMDIESEKRLREDEIKRSRDIEDIGAKAKATSQAKIDTIETDVRAQTEKVAAEKKARLPQALAESEVDKQRAVLEAEKKGGINRLRADLEKDKYDALIDSGLPEAKARAEAKAWAADKSNRKAKVEEETTLKIEAAKTEAADADYLGAIGKKKVAESKGTIAEIQAREAAYDKRYGTGGGKGAPTTLDLERQAKAASETLAEKLYVPKNKVNEALGELQTKADRGDAKAIAKLKEIQPDLDAWRITNRALRDRNSVGKDRGSDTGGYKAGDTQVIQSGPNKGRTAVYDGNGWTLQD